MYISRALLREQKPFRISSLEASGERSAQSLPILDGMNHQSLSSAIRPRCRRGYLAHFGVASGGLSLYRAEGRGVIAPEQSITARSRSICSHRRDNMDKNLLRDEKLKSIAQRYNVSEDSLGRHKTPDFGQSLGRTAPKAGNPMLAPGRSLSPIAATEWVGWCPGSELNRYVPFRTRDFKSRASASFATRALRSI